MTVIIGHGTTVTSTQFPDGGIVSVNVSLQKNLQRLYQLGSKDPYDNFINQSTNIQLVVYGKDSEGERGTIALAVSPSTTCVDTTGIAISVSFASCIVDEALSSFNTYYLTGYSYQKDNLGVGQETWSLTTKPTIPGYTGTIVMIRGLAEGAISVNPDSLGATEMGLIIDSTASDDIITSDPIITNETGNVQGNSTGDYDKQRAVIATSVGGSTSLGSSVAGKSGSANINSPVTPVFT